MEKFYTRPEFSDATGIAIRTLERWSKKKLPPAKYDGKRPLYSDAQIAVAKSLHQPEFSGHKNSTATGETKSELIKNLDSPFLPASDVITLDERANRIRALQADVQRGIIQIGFELIAAKEQVGHGNWSAWLENEFNWTQRTANNFMRVAERFGKMENVFHFKPSTLQAMLALTEGTEQEFIGTQAEAGKPVELQSARELQRNVKEFNAARVTSKNSTEEPTIDLSNRGEFFSIFGHEPETPADETATQPARADLPADDSAKKLPTIALNRNESVCWYTPQYIIDAAREVLGTIDIDPASDSEANKTVKAIKFYSVDEDGLLQDWRGRIWLNPPFANGLIDKFVDKLLAEIERGFVTAAICLTDNATETRWFRRLADNSVAIVFTTGRINFLKAGASHSGTPTRGQAFFYYGDNPDKFFQVFSNFGWCCRVFADDFTAKK